MNQGSKAESIGIYGIEGRYVDCFVFTLVCANVSMATANRARQPLLYTSTIPLSVSISEAMEPYSGRRFGRLVE